MGLSIKGFQLRPRSKKRSGEIEGRFYCTTFSSVSFPNIWFQFQECRVVFCATAKFFNFFSFQLKMFIFFLRQSFFHLKRRGLKLVVRKSCDFEPQQTTLENNLSLFLRWKNQKTRHHNSVCKNNISYLSPEGRYIVSH